MAALGQDVELVTLTIGGNVAMFASVLKECIKGGFIPFGDCAGNPEKAEHVVQDAFARLRGEPTRYGKGEEKTVPLAQLYSRILQEAPRARVIVLGYPQFFRTGGTHLFKCSLVTKGDQIWVNEKVEETNDLLEDQASSLGLEFVDPSDAFEGHRRCEIGGGAEQECSATSSWRQTGRSRMTRASTPTTATLPSSSFCWTSSPTRRRRSP